MRIGIDLDGVTYDFVNTLKDYASQYGIEGNGFPWPKSWDFYKDQWGWSLAQYLEVFGDGVRAGYIFAMGAPIAGALSGLAALRKAGHEVVIVTHRDHPDPYVAFLMKIHTIDWLMDHDIEYDALMFTGQKTERGVDVMLDDAPHNIIASAEAGERVVVFDQDWNQELPEDIMATVERVHSWGDFVRLMGEAS